MAAAAACSIVVRQHTHAIRHRPPSRRRGGRTWIAVSPGAEIVGSRHPHTPPIDTLQVKAGWLMSRHVRVHAFAAYLNQGPTPPPDWEHPQLERKDGRWRARAGCERQVLAWVTAHEAEQVAAWLGRLAGGRGRLPTEAEWLRGVREERPGRPFQQGYRAGETPDDAPPAWCRHDLVRDRWMLKQSSRKLAERIDISPTHRHPSAGIRAWLVPVLG